MEMSEGWKKNSEGADRCINSEYLKMMGEEHRFILDLMKEMAEALEKANDIIKIYVMDTLIILKKEEDAKQIIENAKPICDVLKKFKEWK